MEWRVVLGVVVGLGACGESSAVDAPIDGRLQERSDSNPNGEPRIYGVTITNPWSQMPALIDALESLGPVATSRVVFDLGVAPDEYGPILMALSDATFIMGEIVDSFQVASLTVDQFVERTHAYLTAHGARVDIWSIGNDVNGEWLGSTADVVAKVSRAFDVVAAAGQPTAMTLYYNQDCWSDPAHEIFAWADANVPARLKSGLDYVWLSFSAEDCNEVSPDWEVVFDQLGTMFPNARLGFGEVGSRFALRKADVVNEFYRLDVAHPRFVSGNFWSYFDANPNGAPGDMVPKTAPLWAVLNDAMIAGSQL